jgi:hypothetical protein
LCNDSAIAMKQIHFILIAMLFSFIGLSSFITIKQEVYNNSTSNKVDEEDAIIGKIYKLREVQEHEKYLQKVRSKSHISFIVTEKPSKRHHFMKYRLDTMVRFVLKHTSFCALIRNTSMRRILNPSWIF